MSSLHHHTAVAHLVDPDAALVPARFYRVQIAP
jgi:hypothetical protein